MQKTTLQFPSMLKRILGLRKFKKEHSNVLILEKGFATTGCGHSYYWAKVQYDE